MAYVNPFRSTTGLTAGRIDNGVDYFADNNAIFVAPGACKVYDAYTHPPLGATGLNNEAWIAATFLSGYHQGSSFYFAESIAPAVSIGDTLAAGDILGHYTGNSRGIECGWAAGPSNPRLAQAASLGEASPTGAISTKSGISWNNFLISLGAPGGSLQQKQNPISPFTNPFAPIAPHGKSPFSAPPAAAQRFAGNTPWPLPIAAQAEAIKGAIEQYGIPVQVFMGMYSVETNFGFLRNADGSIQTSPAGATGPFQFTAADKNTGVIYPMTSTPNFNEFIQQANAAAALLKANYKQSPPPKSWHWALAAYNAGRGNAGAGSGYADKALHAQIPANWTALIGSGPAVSGGVVGANGTGTLLNQSSGFTVGDPTNPDEDYWTASNRLCQERYWYLFSDGETLYLADGPDLMKQTPAAKLDRIGNLDQINHLDFTWDNPLALKTPLLTTDGWKTMGTIAVGDEVYAEDGTPTRVLGVSPVFPDRPCYEVTFADGAKIIASDDHHWKVKSAFVRNASWQNLTTEDIASNWRCKTTNRNRYRVRCDAVPQCSPVDLPIDAYVLGLWLGDGHKHQPSIGVGMADRPHVLAAIGEAGYRVTRETHIESDWGEGCSVYFTNDEPVGHGLRRRLSELNVLNNKHIPDMYLRAAPAQRRALLAGLLDSDGSIYGANGAMQVKFSASIERLARDVHVLARSLGARAVINGYGAKQRNGYIERPHWNVTWCPLFDPFRLPRKSARFIPRATAIKDSLRKRNLDLMSITDVKPVPPVPTRCIMVEHESHVFLAGRTFVPTRNTAWQYAATHKKRKRTQRRTSLAKVTSPVEATLALICAIDECRAGDVIHFTNTGPGDGDWLVGDCRRSVFEVMSEITLVVALTPLTEGALNPAGVSKTNLSSQVGSLGVGVGKYKGYVNPVGNWRPSRIDAGVDGTLSGPYLAPGDSFIVIADQSNAGWQGGGIIGGRLLNGPLKGLVWYVAEGVAPLVPPNATVKAGTPVARLATNPYNTIWGNIETGWANPAAPGQPYGFVGNSDDQGPKALAFGNSFNRFLIKLGAKTGAVQGRGVNVAPAPLPPGYP